VPPVVAVVLYFSLSETLDLVKGLLGA